MKVAQSCLTLCDPMDCCPPESSVHGILQTRILEWYSKWCSKGTEGNCSLLQGIFPTQGSNPGLPHCQLSHKGSPRILEWAAYPFSSGSSRPRNRNRVSCIASGLQAHYQLSYQRSPIRDVLLLLLLLSHFSCVQLCATP